MAAAGVELFNKAISYDNKIILSIDAVACVNALRSILFVYLSFNSVHLELGDDKKQLLIEGANKVVYIAWTTSEDVDVAELNFAIPLVGNFNVRLCVADPVDGFLCNQKVNDIRSSVEDNGYSVNRFNSQNLVSATHKYFKCIIYGRSSYKFSAIEISTGADFTGTLAISTIHLGTTRSNDKFIPIQQKTSSDNNRENNDTPSIKAVNVSIPLPVTNGQEVTKGDEEEKDKVKEEDAEELSDVSESEGVAETERSVDNNGGRNIPSGVNVMFGFITCSIVSVISLLS